MGRENRREEENRKTTRPECSNLSNADTATHIGKEGNCGGTFWMGDTDTVLHPY